jgi:hypothetical protein
VPAKRLTLSPQYHAGHSETLAPHYTRESVISLTSNDWASNMYLTLASDTAQVEAALHSHPAVTQAAVFGVDNEILGQMVHAAVVLRPGRSASPRELTAHARALLSGYKVGWCKLTPVLKAPRCQRFKLKYDRLLSSWCKLTSVLKAPGVSARN